MFYNILQVIVALIIVLILFLIGFSLFSLDILKTVSTTSDTLIFNGIYDLGSTKNLSFNTYNKNFDNYIELKPSVNRVAGAEYSYNFWLWKDLSLQNEVTDPTSQTVVKDKGLDKNDIVLLLRGVNKAVKYKSVCNIEKTDVLVKSPLIKFEQGGDVLTVELNTEQAPDSVLEGASRNSCTTASSSWFTTNNHKLSVKNFRNANYDKQWFMVTVVVRDTVPVDNLPNRNNVNCQIYINAVLVLDHYLSNKLEQTGINKTESILKQNNGNLYIMPEIATAGGLSTSTGNNGDSIYSRLLMANLQYSNYALTQAQVTELYNKKFDNSLVLEPSKTYDYKQTKFSTFSTIQPSSDLSAF